MRMGTSFVQTHAHIVHIEQSEPVMTPTHPPKPSELLGIKDGSTVEVITGL